MQAKVIYKYAIDSYVIKSLEKETVNIEIDVVVWLSDRSTDNYLWKYIMTKLLLCMFQFAPELHIYEYFSEWLN